MNIGIVGKYVELEDSYKSLNEALSSTPGVANDVRVQHRIGSSPRTSNDRRRSRRERQEALRKLLASQDGGPRARGASGCAGPRGWSPRHDTRVRTGVPYFGICLGLQVACIEFGA